METNNKNSSNDINELPQVILCPVCLAIKAIETMRDLEITLGEKTHVLAICDGCYEKYIRTKQDKSPNGDFPF